MDARGFLGLQPTSDPSRWRMPVTRGVCSSIGALFGGCGLAAGVEALEQATGRPLIWATAQFLSFASPPSVLDIRTTEIVRGHQVSQARAAVSLDGEEIVTVTAALGRRSFSSSGSWAVRPDVPPPEQCPARPLRADHEGTLADRVETRIAVGRHPGTFPAAPGDGRAALWLRIPELGAGSAVLAIAGDYVPFGISQSLGEPAGGNSLDNTVRVVHAEAASGWILADVRLHAVAHGFAHGLVHLWSQDGVLLGTAAQSAIVRRWDSERFRS
ncbi:MAG TPA: thioesterase family protein [Candidatus Dormibacteraeota bacterium]|nr:thioesterase family protein [Candidatus Dormibacteraeota bacterium]